MHCYSLSDACDRERGQGYETTQGRFQAEMWALGTAGENCTEVTGRLRWTIQISSESPRDLAQLEGRSAKFLEESNVGYRGAWKQKLRNSWREEATGCRRLGIKNCAILGGS